MATTTTQLQQPGSHYLPFRVVVFKKIPFVRPRHNNKAAVLSVDLLHRSPRADHPVGWSKWKVVKILVHRVP